MTKKATPAVETAVEMDFLKGCTICNEGLKCEVDKLVEKHKFTERKASEAVADAINKKLGCEMFKPDAIRKRVRREGGHEDGAGHNVPKNTKVKSPLDGGTIEGLMTKVKNNVEKALAAKMLEVSKARRIRTAALTVAAMLEEVATKKPKKAKTKKATPKAKAKAAPAKPKKKSKLDEELEKVSNARAAKGGKK